MLLRFVRMLLLILLAGCALIFAALNPDRVGVELAFLRTSSSLGIALLVAAAVGLLAGILWRVNWVAQLLAERGRLRRALRLAEAKVRERAAAADSTHIET